MPLRFDTEGRVAIITLDRPAARNAFDLELLDAFEDALGRFRDEPSLWVAIVTGANGCFSGGADLKRLPMQLPERGPDAVLDISLLFSRLAIEKPVIAAIEGPAMGGGCEIALACDLRVAAEGASIGLPETRRGLIPGWGGTQRLPRLIGAGRAKAMILTGQPVDAFEAHRIGLVNRVASEGEALDAARELAAEICACAPSAVRLAKRAIDEGASLELADGLRLENGMLNSAIESPNFGEGVVSFIERRDPVWSDE